MLMNIRRRCRYTTSPNKIKVTIRASENAQTECIYTSIYTSKWEIARFIIWRAKRILTGALTVNKHNILLLCHVFIQILYMYNIVCVSMYIYILHVYIYTCNRVF